MRFLSPFDFQRTFVAKTQPRFLEISRFIKILVFLTP